MHGVEGAFRRLLLRKTSGPGLQGVCKHLGGEEGFEKKRSHQGEADNKRCELFRWDFQPVNEVGRPWKRLVKLFQLLGWAISAMLNFSGVAEHKQLDQTADEGVRARVGDCGPHEHD